MLEFEMETLALFAEGIAFPEGPVALADGSLLVTEIRGNSVARLAADGSVMRRYPTAAGPNGMAAGPDGAVYVVSDGGLVFEETDGIFAPVNVPSDFVGGVIERLDPESGDIAQLYHEVDGHHLGVLNDCVFDAAGFGYVVDTVYGKVYYFDPAGGDIRTAGSGFEAPNGFALAPDGKAAYLSETYSGKVWKIPVDGAGVLGDKQLHYSTDGEHGFDGLAIDGHGNVCVASLGVSAITVISPEGDKLGVVAMPLHDPFVTNICFTGEDMRTAYICSAGRGRVYTMRWPHPGLRLNCNI